MAQWGQGDPLDMAMGAMGSRGQQDTMDMAMDPMGTVGHLDMNMGQWETMAMGATGTAGHLGHGCNEAKGTLGMQTG